MLYVSLSLSLSLYIYIGVTSMDSTFYGNSKFDSDLGSWDTSKVTKLERTFELASVFRGQGVQAFDVSRVTSMDSTFRRAKLFDADLSNWYPAPSLSSIIYPRFCLNAQHALHNSNTP